MTLFIRSNVSRVVAIALVVALYFLSRLPTISSEELTSLAARFKFTFTPKHGSWLNLIEGFFSKLARSVLRHIRVSSKQELKDRLMAAMDFFNRAPVVHTWTYKLDKAA